MLDKGLKEKWIDALKSGEYRQGTFFLYNSNTDSHCVLGVLCAVVGIDGYKGDDSTAAYAQLRKLLPNKIVKILKEKNDGMNRQRKVYTFKELATWIKKHVPSR